MNINKRQRRNTFRAEGVKELFYAVIEQAVEDVRAL